MLSLAPRYIYFPRGRRETTEAIKQFVLYQCWTPQIVGALASTHIPIVSPNVHGKADYFSRKQCYTFSTQGLVGRNLVFLDIVTGFPGSWKQAPSFPEQF